MNEEESDLKDDFRGDLKGEEEPASDSNVAMEPGEEGVLVDSAASRCLRVGGIG